MYTAIMRGLSRVIPSVIVIFSANTATMNEPKEPTDPSVQYEKGTNRFSKRESRSSNTTVRITFADSGILDATVTFSNITIHIQNPKKQRSARPTVQLDNVRRIEILRWKAVPQPKNLYKFVPSEYSIVTEENTYTHYGNLKFLNVFKYRQKKESRKAYTLFYDYWTHGKKGKFYWQNSKSFKFDYNFTHPLGQVVTAIDFIHTDENE